MRAGYLVHAAQAFAAVAEARAAHPALRWPDGTHTTFAELDRSSNRIARRLIDRGVRKRATVALCLEKSPLAYSVIVACLKIGAPYFAVDPANPPARTRLMLGRCRPAFAFIEPSSDAGVFDCETVVAGDDRSLSQMAAAPDAPLDVTWRIDGADPAYIMFTSGSTGTPKGVTISQDNLAHFIQWSRSEFQTRPEDVFTGLNPLFFDNSVFDLYSSVFAGASLAPFTAAMLRHPDEVVAGINARGCTNFFSVPSLLVYLQTLKLIDRDTFPTLRRIVFGGEGYPKPMLARLHDQLGSRIELVNVYGPTECTCIASVYRISSGDFADPNGYAPLGTLLPGFSHVIIDASGRPVGPGETGELCLGGPSVGLGYYGAPEQTAAAFIQHPGHDRFVERVYRTGDLVREDPADGRIHFAGRADSQIKHQGYRIELGEIEHALASVEGVDEAAAVHSRAGGVSRIVAVVASHGPLTAAGVKQALMHSLPAYMMPERVIVVERLMKNANGKIDRSGIVASIERGAL